jgi:hypothetical protein
MWIINSFVSFFNENSGFISIILTLVGVYVAWKIYKKTHRPVVFIEITSERSFKDVRFGEFSVNISNVGNILAKNISICCSDEELNKIFKTTLPENVKYSKHVKELFRTIFNNNLKYLSFKNDITDRLFGHEHGNKNTDIINFNTEFNVTVTYYDYLTNLKYEDIIVMSIKEDSSMSGYYTDPNIKKSEDKAQIINLTVNYSKEQAYLNFISSLNSEDLSVLSHIIDIKDRNTLYDDKLKKLNEFMNKTKNKRLKLKIRKYLISYKGS